MDFENTISCKVKKLPDLIIKAEQNTMFVVSGKCKHDGNIYKMTKHGCIYTREFDRISKALEETKPGIKIGLDLKKVKGIKNLRGGELASCESLVTVKLPDTIEELGWTFGHSTSLESVEIPENVENCITNNIFVSCNALKELKTTNLKIEGNFILAHFEEGVFLLSFLNKNNETDVTIPDDVTIIADGAFCECESLKSVRIPEGTLKIGEQAFRECTSLTEIKIPKSVTSIGARSFSNCVSLKRIEIPESVTEIEHYAFEYCTSLEEIRIFQKATHISKDIFVGCSSLKKVFIPKGCKIEFNTFPKATEIFEYSISDGGKEICEKRRADFPVTATSFEDILKLDEEGIKSVLSNTDMQELAKALKGSSEEIQQKIFNTMIKMSKRAAAMLKRDMEFMGPLRKIDVEESKRCILATIQELEKFGTIKL